MPSSKTCVPLPSCAPWGWRAASWYAGTERSFMTDSVAEAVNAAVEKHQVHITAFWCGWEGRRVWDFYEGQLTLGLVPADYRVERLKMLMEDRISQRRFTPQILPPMCYMPENPYDPNYQGVLTACKAIVEKCRENGQNFLFETGQETPVTLKRAIQDIDEGSGPRKRRHQSGSGQPDHVRQSQSGGRAGRYLASMCGASMEKTDCTPPTVTSWAKKFRWDRER